MSFLDQIKQRRSIYALGNNVTLAQNEIENRRESFVVNDVSSKLSEEDFNLIEEDIEGENEDISMIDFSEEDVLSAQVAEEEDNFDILENLNIIEDI